MMSSSMSDQKVSGGNNSGIGGGVCDYADHGDGFYNQLRERYMSSDFGSEMEAVRYGDIPLMMGSAK